MINQTFWQLFAESGNPLAYLEYRKSMSKPKKNPGEPIYEDI